MPHSHEPEDPQNSGPLVPELSPQQRADMTRLARNLSSHTGPWARWHGGTEVGLNHVQSPYLVWGSDMVDFVETVQRNGLAPNFIWEDWDAGAQWLRSAAPEKFSQLSAEFVVGLFTALIRSDQFYEGSLLSAFDDGTIPALVSHLVELLAD